MLKPDWSDQTGRVSGTIKRIPDRGAEVKFWGLERGMEKEKAIWCFRVFTGKVGRVCEPQREDGAVSLGSAIEVRMDRTSFVRRTITRRRNGEILWKRKGRNREGGRDGKREDDDNIIYGRWCYGREDLLFPGQASTYIHFPDLVLCQNLQQELLPLPKRQLDIGKKLN